MTHVVAPDQRRWRLASGGDLYPSERYDGAQQCSDLNISVASLKRLGGSYIEETASDQVIH